MCGGERGLPGSLAGVQMMPRPSHSVSVSLSVLVAKQDLASEIVGWGQWTNVCKMYSPSQGFHDGPINVRRKKMLLVVT